LFAEFPLTGQAKGDILTTPHLSWKHLEGNLTIVTAQKAKMAVLQRELSPLRFSSRPTKLQKR
jgi:hypothetical protein